MEHWFRKRRLHGTSRLPLHLSARSVQGQRNPAMYVQDWSHHPRWKMQRPIEGSLVIRNCACRTNSWLFPQPRPGCTRWRSLICSTIGCAGPGELGMQQLQNALECQQTFMDLLREGRVLANDLLKRQQAFANLPPDLQSER